MKLKNIIILAAFVFLCQCKKNPEEPYSNLDIVRDNAQAGLYFHAVFREAENAWAFINSIGYKEGTYPDAANQPSIYKEMAYNDSTDIVTIEYRAWPTNHLLLSGCIKLRFDTCSYRIDGKLANVYLSDFSINGQSVVGESSIRYRKVANNTNDNYTFILLDGTAIHKQGRSMPVLISSTMANGQYERIKGNETFSQDDDIWAFSGVMTGMLHNDPNLKYTNTVIPTVTINGENEDIRIYYSMNCKFAQKGFSHITFPKRPDINFLYNCSEYIFDSVTRVQ